MAARTQAAPLTQSTQHRWLPLLVILALAVLAALLPAEAREFPAALDLGLEHPINNAKDWIEANRDTHPLFQFFFEPLSDAIDFGLRAVEDTLLATPWFVLLAVFMTLGLGFSGVRLALLCGGGLMVIGLFGLWEASLQTLALMLVSVMLAVLIGLPLGILVAFSPRADRVLRPLLDAMQTMPTFVYLIPVVLLFGIARVPSVVATLIYALPPMIRLTALGLQQVNPSAIEAARAFGSTPRQLLFKVQLPLALPTIITGVNQTIMMALSMVVIAALIGAGGLGQLVKDSLQRLQVGAALEAGLAIVLLAIILDRLTEAFSLMDSSDETPRRPSLPKWLPATWEAPVHTAWDAAARMLTAPARWAAALLNRPTLERHTFLISSLVYLTLLLGLGLLLRMNEFPSDWRLSLRAPSDALVRWMRDNLYEMPIGAWSVGTKPLSDFTTLYVLDTFRNLFTRVLPWPVMVLGMAALAFWSGGWRLAMFTAVGMLTIGALSMWDAGMETLSQIVVTMLLTVVIAVPLGIWSSQNDRVRNLLRPSLDFLQTIPSFVFLVPVIMLFNLGRVPGVIAAVLYAIAPGVKLTDLGIRQVAGEAVEAARAFGSTQIQTLTKVQVPMALPAILLGVNQMIMMVLAMVIISGMVGGAGLGYAAVLGFARSQEQTGNGMEAGLAIVLIAIILDRITQAWATKHRRS
jgi:glycine betaine/proline transport system permease protein